MASRWSLLGLLLPAALAAQLGPERPFELDRMHVRSIASKETGVTYEPTACGSSSTLAEVAVQSLP